MKILDTYLLQGRGQLVFVELDGSEPKIDSRMKRVSDGTTWPVRGIEWWAIPRRPGKGDRCGLLLPLTPPIKAGEEIVRE